MATGLKIALVIAVVAGTIAVATIMNRAPTSSGDLISKVERATFPVQTVVLSPTTAVERLARTGVLRADKDATVSPEVAGRVRKVNKELGDRCAKGEVIVQLDEEGYRIGVAQTKAAVAQAQVALDQAERAMARVDRLKERAVATDQEWDSAKGGVDASRAAVEQAKAAHRLALWNLSETSVRCPFDGLVAERYAQEGQLVGPAAPVARLVDSTTLRLTINVQGAQLSRLSVGQRVELRDPADPSMAARGEVSRLGVAADEQTRTFPVEIIVGEGGLLRPGQVVEAVCELAVHENALLVPEHAVIAEGERPTVVLVVDGAASPVEVELGPKIGDFHLVSSGLKAGDEVITVGKDALSPGASVTVVTEAR